MATVQLSDVYEPTTFEELIQERSDENNAFLASGVMIDSDKLTGMANVGGKQGEMPAYKPVTKDEPDYTNDDNTDDSTPDNIGHAVQRWRLAKMHKSWSAMDFARELTLSDPVDAITSEIGLYWAAVHQARLIYSALGILADNVANDSEDMLYSIATDDAAAIEDAERVSAEAVILAAATRGDRMEDFAAIAVHSMVYSRMRLNDLITTELDSNNKPINLFGTLRVVIDDGMPAVAGTNRITYTSVLFKSGIFGMGKGRAEQPSEIERKAASGNGGGETILHSRDNRIIHPWGFDWLEGSVAAESPTYAELQEAANWDRTFSRKNCGLAFLQTNG